MEIYMNLIDRPHKECGNYLCTWTLQEALARKLNLPGDSMTMCQRNAIDEKHLFETDFYHIIPREHRGGLFFLLDDGAEMTILPFGVEEVKLAELKEETAELVRPSLIPPVF